ncbi:MAG: histone deacetylase family protein [Spirochaetes bacterium]|jgi:acetoin utilization deacetylase AcuC-like enzyme|nr:histone deacetylase family protein [Spirochaetota bacterium]
MRGISRHRKLVRLVYHPIYLTPYSTADCESPERVRAIMSRLASVLEVVEPEPCAEEDILRCHTHTLLAQEKNSPDRYEAARMAAGGAIRAAREALDGFVAFGVLRPPGHHANPDHNWGFCFFNNMGVAIKRLLHEGLVDSAVILDIDLHFGDGTEAIFRPHRNVRVLNIQSSQPGEFLRETRAALDAVERTGIIGISAGFDQYEHDWGGNLSTDDYRTIGHIAGAFAREKAGGKIFGILEGGYYVQDLGKNLEALLTGICEGRSGAV